MTPEQKQRADAAMAQARRKEADRLMEAELKSAGLKFDTGKPPLDLLSRVWLEGTAEVLAFGAKKYAAHNWRKGIQFSRLLASAQRHILAFQDGENTDPETGLSHLYHASCCLMFLAELSERMPEMDDRYKRVAPHCGTCTEEHHGRWASSEENPQTIPRSGAQ